MRDAGTEAMAAEVWRVYNMVRLAEDAVYKFAENVQFTRLHQTNYIREAANDFVGCFDGGAFSFAQSVRRVDLYCAEGYLSLCGTAPITPATYRGRLASSHCLARAGWIFGQAVAIAVVAVQPRLLWGSNLREGAFAEQIAKHLEDLPADYLPSKFSQLIPALKQLSSLSQDEGFQQEMRHAFDGHFVERLSTPVVQSWAKGIGEQPPDSHALLELERAKAVEVAYRIEPMRNRETDPHRTGQETKVSPPADPVVLQSAHPAPAGRTIATDDYENRKRVAERWNSFKGDYTTQGYNRPSWDNFAAWASEQFDDLPSDDPAVLKRMVDAYRKTPTPRNLV